ncbi:hypothetical protein ACFQXB_13045 [Plastorhodobacter daqingensis]|uniref:AsmA-like C-terminal domain-containing protein n=1 Tax=Plastorhodobacter daqingensis TaxID=1387281 RepID=A0ABW2UKA6_9RHOB
MLALTAGITFLSLTGRPVPVPGWILTQAEIRLNAGLGTRLALRLGGAEIQIDRGLVPRLVLRDLVLLAPERGSEPIARIPVLEAGLSRDELLAGQLRPTVLRLAGGHATLRRDEYGRFDLALGQADLRGPGSLAEVLDAVDRAFELPALRGITRIEAEKLALTLEDARAGETWQVTDGRIAVVQDDSTISLSLGFGMTGTWGTPAEAELRFVSQRAGPEATLEVRFQDVAAGDIAAQSAALAWLSVLEAPISGALTAQIDAKGAISALQGGLSLGAGALRPEAGMRAIGFDTARLDLEYDAEADRLAFNNLRIDSPTLRLRAEGHAYLRDFDRGLPETLLGQFRFADVQIDPEGLFAEPVRFDEGAVDLRVALSPFSATLGQLVLIEDGRRLSATGRVAALPEGWDLALDLALNEITHDRLLALWPPELVRGMRNWLVENVQTGLIYNVTSALRLAPGQEPRLAVGYEFSDADVRFLRTMPPILSGRGYAAIEGTAYTMVLDAGQVAAPQGGLIDVRDSVFQVADVTQRPATAMLKLNTESSITAALAFLDEPPFGFLSRARRPVDLAEGRAELQAVLRFPLMRGVPPDQVEYHVTGRLSDVQSDRIVPGQQLRSDEMTIEVTPALLRIAGPGRLGEVPFDAVWTQPLGPAAAGMGSRLEGRAELSAAAVAQFAPALPAGLISGRGSADFRAVLRPDEAPRFELDSDLLGLGLAIPAVGWSKGPEVPGRLALAATLGAQPDVTRIELSAPGLAGEGAVALGANGGLDALRLSRVRLGRWLDAPVVLRGRGPGQPLGIEVTGGTLDLRGDGLPALDGAGRGGQSMQAGPIRLRLDRVLVAEGLALTGFDGRMSTQGGLNGLFEARVNGGSAVSGKITPLLSPDGVPLNRSMIEVTAADGGGVLAAAGLADRVAGGAMTLRLVPRGRGHFDGALHLGPLSIIRAPALAEILGALSIVGLLEQLNGQGIVFSETTAQFRLTPQGIEIIRGAATGPSLGVTLAGVYDSASKRLDMQGVVSPVFLINVMGSLIARPGEGLFGFNYALAGPVEAPAVSVNPLSILLPGPTRDLLRRPAAALSDSPAVSQSR